MSRPVALVTGGTRGIGLAIAESLAQHGFDLAVNGVRDEEAVAGVIGALKETGARVVYARGDIGSPSDRNRILQTVLDAFGKITVLVNNAGVAPSERLDILNATEESYERVMGINLKGPYLLTRDVARIMVEQRGGGSTENLMIINIGSISATVVSVNRGDYCLSKAAFGMHSKLWAVRLAEYEIGVYEVRPGIIETDMTAAVTEKYEKLIAGGLTIQPRLGKPGDIARVVQALVSGAMPYSSGEVIMADGGLTIPRL
jgi:NAD(P)-dependent dehydrogenase (short-subunit alcohol dehydrogenase family)